MFPVHQGSQNLVLNAIQAALAFEGFLDCPEMGLFYLRRSIQGNGNPLQCSCLESPRDGGAYWAAVYGVAQSRTQWRTGKWISPIPTTFPSGKVGGELKMSAKSILTWTTVARGRLSRFLFYLCLSLSHPRRTAPLYLYQPIHNSATS